MELHIHDRNSKFFKYDYVFNNWKDYMKMEPYLRYSKIGSPWLVCLLDWKMQELRDFMQAGELPSTKVDIYLKRDMVAKFGLEFSDVVPEKKTPYEQYLELLSVSPITLEKKASQELFKRCKGKAEEIESVLKELEDTYGTEEAISVKQLNTVVVKEDTVYGKDVLLGLFIKNNSRVPRRGHRLSKYKYCNYWADLQKLIDNVGEEKAFYFLRKPLKELYTDKIRYNTQQDVEKIKNEDAIRVIDTYTLTHAYLTFLTNCPASLMAVIATIEGRQQGHNYLQDMIEQD